VERGRGEENAHLDAWSFASTDMRRQCGIHKGRTYGVPGNIAAEPFLCSFLPFLAIQ
jgi:hypothetical protein